ncbi:MAG: epimerase [Bacteroides sp. SM1_62]|nr:MAG: epimerase [Bacteroides sp. SM23_62]KPL22377.1 MAG: epimerase [Bacteroides sp. SM1_62]
MRINAILFGATGMIGQGVLIEALEHPQVASVLSISRRSCGVQHTKLTEIIHDDFLDYAAIKDQLSGFDACFFCLGVSSAGISPETYYAITHDYAVAAADVLSRLNPDMVFCFISGAGTDDQEKSRMRWARVKGKAENSLKSFPFKGLFLMRPAYVQHRKGVRPSFMFYRIFAPVYPLLRFLFPKTVTNTEEVGRAMINAVLFGAEKQTLENRDIIELAKKT